MQMAGAELTSLPQRAAPPTCPLPSPLPLPARRCNSDPAAVFGPIKAGGSSSSASPSPIGSTVVPRVQAMDGPTADDAQFAEVVALHAGRALLNSPSSGYLSPTGCCAGPVRTMREMAGGIVAEEETAADE